MRIAKLWIDGYGRFSNRVVELSPGLQVLLGPNEQGKTTLRFFIGDMLFGQKRGTSQRTYDESNELRRPWNNPECYRGRMIYALDDGREIQVHRNFDRQTESVTIYDLTHAKDVTNEFARLRNHEPNFGETHLGVSKAVFLNTATIGHTGLEHLGDKDALAQVREKLLSLADTGEEDNSAYAAIKILEERIAAIGRPTAKTKPLPRVRTRLAELGEELRAAQRVKQEMAATEQRRIDVATTLVNLRANRAGISDELDAIEKRDRAELLRQIDDAAEQIDEITQRCFSVSAGRDFPLEKVPEVQRLENIVNTARNQLKRSVTELEATRKQLDQELAKLGPESARHHGEIEPDWDERIAQLESEMIRMRERLDAAEAAFATAENRLHEAQRDLASLPDFSRIAPDPVEWLNDLVQSYALLQRRRDEARTKLRALHARAAHRTQEIATPRAIFGNSPAFMEEARNFDVEARVVEKHLSGLITRIEQLNADEAYLSEYIPGFRLMAFICSAGIVFCLTAAYYMQQLGLVLAAVGFGFAIMYFLGNMIYSRRGVARIRVQIEQTRHELTTSREMHERKQKDMLMRTQAAGCKSMRELEAAYEKYREDSARLEALQSEFLAQQELVQTEELQTSRSYDDVRQKLAIAGESIEDEREIPAAASRAASRFQAYRDAKRRVYDGRERLVSLQAELDKARDEFDTCSKRELESSLELRELLRKNEFPEERKHTSALSALRAYRTRFAQVKHKRGRVEVLQEKQSQLEEQLTQDTAILEKSEADLQRHLAAAHIATMDEWRDRAEQARQYQELWAKRVALIQQRETLLRGVNLEDLRRNVERDGTPAESPDGDADSMRRELDQLSEMIDTHEKEEHRLLLDIASRGAGARSLNEIEEEMAELDERARQLDLEFNAATYAAAVLEEAARDKHARIAPKLAKAAGEYLTEITGGVYSELLISRDLTISVRIPQTTKMHEGPERNLSKGTADQIYLSLRLALVQSMSATGERIPMLLDDPFTNYDDQRLERAMKLLVGIGRQSQILLMTCRDDVAKVARAIGTPVIEL
jgi:uncharacterized protein YhaN